jgi:fructokinase
MRIGIDLGGTKIEVLVLDEAGVELARTRVPTPRGDYHATLAAIETLVTDFERRFAAPASVGVGHPGAISPHTGLVKNANSTWLNGRPLAADLSRVLARPVRLANDADCFALSEAIDGSAAGAPIVFGVIVGTGTGAGIAVGGKLLSGVNAIAGEWGHNPLPWPTPAEWPGPRCYCGRTGCIETFLSGPGFERDYRSSNGEDLRAPDIVSRAAQGEAIAAACLGRYVDRMARGLAAVINVLDPHVIVLGGGLSNIERLYDSVPALWPRYVFSDHVATRLAPPKHGDSSGVRGAAWLSAPRS